MKKIFIFGFLISLIIASCGYKEEIEKLKQENDSLRNLTQDDQMTINEYLAAFNEIQENLNEIKRTENIITLNTSDSEVTTEQKDQIISDIQRINQLMQENKRKIEELKEKLKKEGYKNQQLRKTLQLYEEQLRQKDEEINQLKQKLEQLNIKVEELTSQVEELSSTVDTLNKITEEQQKTIENQDIALHTAYYVVGSKQELKENHILTKEGFLSKLTFDTEADLNYFTKIDIREVKTIPLNAKSVEILTKHPASSYTLEKDGKIIKQLTINNPDEFWKFTKFLVIVVK